MAEQSTYLIVPNARSGGTAADLQRCLDAVRSDSQMKITTVRYQPTEQTVLQRLIITATPEAANRLRESFQNRLIIEPDQPLNLFGDTGRSST